MPSEGRVSARSAGTDRSCSYIHPAALLLMGWSHDPQGFSMDGLEIRRKRAFYRASHRGTKELDIMLGRFAEKCVLKWMTQTLLRSNSFLPCPIR